MTSFPTEDLINRRVEYRFAGQSLTLDLSLGLFSSAGVDMGSMLLLKSIGKSLQLDDMGSILDVGCGTGTLGLALAARCPDSSVTLVDRDALAASFSRRNAALNGLKNVNVHTRLMTEGPHEGPYDLIMSNFPAKAGDPVLKDYLLRSSDLLADEGTGALVIVHTLADRCRELIEEVGSEVTLEDASKQHTVFFYRRTGGTVDAQAFKSAGSMSPAPYMRHHGEFKLKRTRYELDTVWNIGDFDTLSWRLKLMGDMLDAEPLKGRMVFWGTGQGHLPAAVCRRRGAKPAEVVLVDRDRLAVLISQKNVASAVPSVPITTELLPDPSLLSSVKDPQWADFLLTDLSPVPRSDWSGPLRDAAAALVKIGGLWAVLGRSADMAVLMKSTKGWTPVADRRNRGWRGVIFRRNS